MKTLTEKIDLLLNKKELNESSNDILIKNVVDDYVRYFMGDSNVALSSLKGYQKSVQKMMEGADLENTVDSGEYNHYYEEFYKDMLKVAKKWIDHMVR